MGVPIHACIFGGEPDLTYWPKARLRKPRFLMAFGGEKTLLRRSFDLLEGLVPMESRRITVPEAYVDQVKSELPEVSEGLVLEPASRGGFNSLALAVASIKSRDMKDVVVAIPSDLFVKDDEIFRRALAEAASIAGSRDVFVTVGSRPAYPEPNHYYLKMQKRTGTAKSPPFYASSFLAQPGRAAALRALESEDSLWSSGVLVFRLQAWWKYLKKFHPDIYTIHRNIQMAAGTGFYHRVMASEFTKLSMADIWGTIFQNLATPRGRGLAVVEVQAQWELMNSWRAFSRIGEVDGNGNLISGAVLSLGTTESVLESEKNLLVTVGLQDVVVIATDDVILVCNKNRQDELKAALTLLRSNGMQKYL